MTIADIQTWLNSNREFYTGLSLYLKYGKSTALKTLFTKKGATRYNTEKLQYELSKLTGGVIPVQPRHQKLSLKVKIVQPTPTFSSPAQTFLPPVYSDIMLPRAEFEKLPEQLKYETIQRVKLYKQAWALHYKLDQQQTDEQRLDLVREITAKMDEVNRLWERIDHYLKHGKIPPDNTGIKPDTAGDDPVSLVKRQMNLRTYISRGTRRLRTLVNPEKRNKLREDIDKWNLELQDIDKKINS